MPWSNDDYPDSFKNENEKVRKKAIEIANALLREDYSEGRAIAIALSQARETIEGSEENRPKFEVKAKENEWILAKKGNSSVIYRESSKEDLLEKAKPYVTEHEGILTIYLADGTIERTLYE